MEMTHRLFAVVLKAENEIEAMKKADVTMTKIMNDPQNMTDDAYWIFDSEEDSNKNGSKTDILEKRKGQSRIEATLEKKSQKCLKYLTKELEG